MTKTISAPQVQQKCLSFELENVPLNVWTRLQGHEHMPRTDVSTHSIAYKNENQEGKEKGKNLEQSNRSSSKKPLNTDYQPRPTKAHISRSLLPLAHLFSVLHLLVKKVTVSLSKLRFLRTWASSSLFSSPCSSRRPTDANRSLAWEESRASRHLELLTYLFCRR